MKTLGIMQPYFFPYIGYFQLINLVDEFVLYDNIQFTKKGWIHRNRMLMNNSDEYFSLPLKKDSDYLNVNQRFLADDFDSLRDKLLRKIEQNYKKAPFFNEFYPLVQNILNYNAKNLFDYIFYSIQVINKYLDISTKIICSSTLPGYIEDLKGKDKVIEINKILHATTYVNSSGGIELYNKEEFKTNGINLQFYKTNFIEYKQFQNDFVPFLSILDVCMFNNKDQVKAFLNQYTYL